MGGDGSGSYYSYYKDIIEYYGYDIFAARTAWDNAYHNRRPSTIWYNARCEAEEAFWRHSDAEFAADEAYHCDVQARAGAEVRKRVLADFYRHNYADASAAAMSDDEAVAAYHACRDRLAVAEEVRRRNEDAAAAAQYREYYAYDSRVIAAVEHFSDADLAAAWYRRCEDRHRFG